MGDHDDVIRQIMLDGCPHCYGLPFVWSGGVPYCPRCLIEAACPAIPRNPLDSRPVQGLR